MVLATAFNQLLGKMVDPEWTTNELRRRTAITDFVASYQEALAGFDGASKPVAGQMLVRFIFQQLRSHNAASGHLPAADRVGLLATCLSVDHELHTQLILEIVSLSLQDHRNYYGFDEPQNPLQRDGDDQSSLLVLALLKDGAESKSSYLFRVPDTQPALAGLWFRELSCALLTSHISECLAANDVLAKDTASNRLASACAFLLRCAEVAGQRGAVAREVFDRREPLVNAALFHPADKNQTTVQGWLSQARKNMSDDERLDNLEKRVAALEKRVDDLEVATRQLAQQLRQVSDLLSEMQRRVTVLEEWQETVDERLTNIELRFELLEVFGLPPGARGRPMASADTDRDLIDDVVEGMLLDALSPVFMVDPRSRPPASVEWFVQHSRLQLRDAGGSLKIDQAIAESAELMPSRERWRMDFTRFLPAYEGFVSQVVALRDVKDQGVIARIRQSVSLKLDSTAFRGGASDVGMTMDWVGPITTGGNHGVYGHVVRGNAPDEYFVQYFMLLAWNETSYTGGYGNHEGDWLMVTLAVRLPEYASGHQPPSLDRLPSEYAAVEWAEVCKQVLVQRSGDGAESGEPASKEITAIVQALTDPLARKQLVVAVRMCNHGRYIDVSGDHVEWTDGGNSQGTPLVGGIKPVFWLESGANELWPNAGGRGFGGWPAGAREGRNMHMNEAFYTYAGQDHDEGPSIRWRSVARTLFRDGKDHQEVDGAGGLIHHDAFKTNPWEFPVSVDAGDDLAYRIGFDFGLGEGGTAINEHKVVRGHSGSAQYRTYGVQNLGEVDFPLTATAAVVLQYHGEWGGWCKPGSIGCPPGPWKPEMWIDVDPTKPQEWYNERGRTGCQASQFSPRIRVP